MPVVDYTRGRLGLRFKKATRYARIYGPRRTLAKIEGQYHMQGRRAPLVQRRRKPDPNAHVGVIGCGNMAFSTIAYFLEHNVGQVIRGAMDIVPERAESLVRRYGGHYGTQDAERVLADPAIDLVYIASNHASHADYAIEALRMGKSVHIEKPHVVDDKQLTQLCEAMESSTGRVRLGFNRPVSPLGVRLNGLLREHAGPVTSSWFIVGYRLPDAHWYNDPGEGGRVLGNLCHWTDVSYHWVEEKHRYPIDVHPIRSDTDIVACLVFGDGSSASLTFASSGDLFEGVREQLGLQRGDLMAFLTDFERLRVDVRDRREEWKLRRRDPGHKDSVMRSYDMSDRAGASPYGESVRYVWETGDLFLRVREALDGGQPMRVTPYQSASAGSSATLSR